MRVGFVIVGQLSGKGGMERVLADVIEGLAQYGIQSEIFALLPFVGRGVLDAYRPQTHFGYIPGFFFEKRHFKWGEVRKWHKKLQGFYYRKEIRKLFEAAAQNCDVIISLSIDRKLIEYPQGIDLIKKKFPQKLLMTWPHFTLGKYEGLTDIFKTQLDKFDGHLAICQAITEQLQNRFQQTNVYTVYNPIQPPPSAQIRQEAGNPMRFLYVGRIAEQKRVIELIEDVLVHLRGDWTLDIIGQPVDQDMESAFYDVLKRTGLQDRVIYHGWQADPWSVPTDAGVLLLHSQYEGFGLVLAEAMMRGIPCVAADCPTGPSEIIRHGINGWLYPMDDPAACQTILQELIDGIRILPDTQSVCRSVVKFSAEQAIPAFYQIIHKELNKKKASL